MVVNSKGVPPAALIPPRTAWACSRCCRLQGEPSFQVVKMPTSGRSTPPSGTPAAYIKARCGARSGPCVEWRLGSRLLSNEAAMILPLGRAVRSALFQFFRMHIGPLGQPGVPCIAKVETDRERERGRECVLAEH